jgi:hypothetical protein
LVRIVNWGEWAGVEPSSFPEIKTWLETIEQRPAVHKGMNVPDDFSKWIMKGMKDEEDKEKKSQI